MKVDSLQSNSSQLKKLRAENENCKLVTVNR